MSRLVLTLLYILVCSYILVQASETVCVLTSPLPSPATTTTTTTTTTIKHPDIAQHWFRTVTTTVTPPSPSTTLCYLDHVEESLSSPAPTGNQEPYGKGIQPHWIILASLCMLLSIFFIVFSFQYFIITIAAVGFVFASALVWVLLTLAESKEGYPSATIVYMCGSLGGGILVAGAFILFWKFSIPLVGGLGGFLLGIYLWMWRADHVILNVYARMFTAVGIGAVMALLTFVVESMVVVLVTSFLGGFLLILGLDILLHTGLVQAIRSLFNVNPFRTIVYTVDNKIYGMLSAILAVFLVSVILQSYLHRGRRFGVQIVEALEKPLH